MQCPAEIFCANRNSTSGREETVGPGPELAAALHPCLGMFSAAQNDKGDRRACLLMTERILTRGEVLGFGSPLGSSLLALTAACT